MPLHAHEEGQIQCVFVANPFCQSRRALGPRQELVGQLVNALVVVAHIGVRLARCEFNGTC